MASRSICTYESRRQPRAGKNEDFDPAAGKKKEVIASDGTGNRSA
jgi:hypothetical protein